MNMIVVPVLKILLWGLVWVFVLSVEVQQRTLFSYANEYLVRNEFVETASSELASIWGHIKGSVWENNAPKTAVRSVPISRQ